MKVPKNSIDKTRLRRLASELRFQLPYLEKALRIAGVIAELTGERVFNENLVLKGGTALNVYHLNVPRLSVDADFNFVGSTDWNRVQALRTEIDRIVRAVGTEQGYTVNRQAFKIALQAYRLAYRGVSGNDDAVKLEINYLDRVPALIPLDQREPWAELEVDSPPVKCLQITELAGMKLATLCNRGNPRDLYDVAQVSQMSLDRKLVRKIALFQSLITDPTMGSLNPHNHRSITGRDIESELRPLLRKRESVAVEALAAEAEKLTTDLLPLAQNEKEAVEGLREGRWESGSFFSDVRVNPDLANHPGVMLRIRGPAVPRGLRHA